MKPQPKRHRVRLRQGERPANEKKGRINWEKLQAKDIRRRKRPSEET